MTKSSKRDREDDRSGGDDRRSEERQEDARQRDGRRSAEVGGRLLVLPTDREKALPRTITTTKEIENVTWPRIWASVPGADEREDVGEDQE